MDHNIIQEFSIRVVIGFFEIKFNKGPSFFVYVVVVHTFISNQDAIHDISTLETSKLISIDGFMNDLSNSVGENLGQNFVGAERRLIGFIVTASFFFLVMEVKKVAFKPRGIFPFE